MTVVLLETALVELEEAVAYYESRSAALGDSFLDEFLSVDPADSGLTHSPGTRSE